MVLPAEKLPQRMIVMLWISDGVHLSGSGNTLLCNALMQLLYDRYPNLAPMSGDGKNENVGIPMEEALWKDLC